MPPRKQRTYRFLHVPKSAGTSIRQAVLAASPGITMAPSRSEAKRYKHCGFDDFDVLHPEVRTKIAVTQNEFDALPHYDFVQGHFQLSTLTAFTPVEEMVTVLREPRARLMSLYAFWRTRVVHGWRPIPMFDYALLPFGDFLGSSLIASSIDNIVCRMVLGQDHRISPQAFIAPQDTADLARDAIAVLEQFAFVGIQERPEEMWAGISQAFDLTLSPIRENVTEVPDPPLDPSMLSPESLALLAERSTADQAVYLHFVTQRLGGSRAEAEKAVETAYARQLFKLGTLASSLANSDVAEKEPNAVRHCYLHVPKSAGSSVHAALEEALPPGSVSPIRNDDTIYDVDNLKNLIPTVRCQIAATPEEYNSLQDYQLVSGHFRLPTLSALAPLSHIATVLREPRTRLLSLLAYYRSPTVQSWRPNDVFDYALGPLRDFLDSPQAARVTDNIVCRLVLGYDPRIPKYEFIPPAETDGLIADAIALLEQFAFVGIQELPAEMWTGLSEVFGVPLSPKRENVTELPDPPLDEKLFTRDSLELLDQRTTIDRAIYMHFAERSCGSRKGAERLAEAAFARQLFKLGTLGSPVSSPQADDRRIDAQSNEELQTRLLAAEQTAAQAEQRFAELLATRRYRVGAALARPLDKIRRR
jgi:hypothetical protein